LRKTASPTMERIGGARGGAGAGAAASSSSSSSSRSSYSNNHETTNESDRRAAGGRDEGGNLAGPQAPGAHGGAITGCSISRYRPVRACARSSLVPRVVLSRGVVREPQSSSRAHNAQGCLGSLACQSRTNKVTRKWSAKGVAHAGAEAAFGQPFNRRCDRRRVYVVCGV
jgi:hypothetical protein